MKILVPIEESDYSRKALERAVDLASCEGAELIILTVAESFLDLEELFPDVGARDKLAEKSRCLLEAASEYATGRGVAARTMLQHNPSPANVILKTAKEEDVETIVMGHRGRKGLDRYLIGSVATKVVTHATCSVLVVR